MHLANIRIPRVAPRDVRETIELRLEEHVPISGADAVFDYVVVGESAAKRKENMAKSFTPFSEAVTHCRFTVCLSERLAVKLSSCKGSVPEVRR